MPKLKCQVCGFSADPANYVFILRELNTLNGAAFDVPLHLRCIGVYVADRPHSIFQRVLQEELTNGRVKDAADSPAGDSADGLTYEEELVSESDGRSPSLGQEVPASVAQSVPSPDQPAGGQ